MHLERGLSTLNTKRKKTKRKRDAYYMNGRREQNKFRKKSYNIKTTCMNSNEELIIKSRTKNKT